MLYSPPEFAKSMEIKFISLLVLFLCHQIFASKKLAEDFNDEQFFDNSFEVVSDDGFWDSITEDYFIEAIKEPSDSIQESSIYVVEESPAHAINESTVYAVEESTASASLPFENVSENISTPSSEHFSIIQYSDSKTEELAKIFKCSPVDLSAFDADKLEKIYSFKFSSYLQMIIQLEEMQDCALFDLFFMRNFDKILSVVTNPHELHDIILSCIKIDSVESFNHWILNSMSIFNVPIAVVYAAKFGCTKILQFILLNKMDFPHFQYENEEYLKLNLVSHVSLSNIYEEELGLNSELDNFYRMEYSFNHLLGSLFFGALQAIRYSQFECLNLFIKKQEKPSYQNYLLLKESTNNPNLIFFTFIYESIEEPIPESFMKDLLIVAVKNDNEAVVNYLLSLNYKYKVNVNSHLIPAIENKNPSLVKTILELIPFKHIRSNILNCAILSQNDEIFNLLLAKNKLNGRRYEK